MLRQYSPDDILVYIGAEGFVDLFCDSWAAKPWIAFLHFDNGLDDILRWSLGPGLCPSLRREQPAVFSFLERIVKLEQRRRTHDNRDPLNPSGPNEHHPESEQETIPSCQIGCSLSRTMRDNKLVSHCQIFGDETLGATGPQKLGDGNESVDKKYECDLHCREVWPISQFLSVLKIIND